MSPRSVRLAFIFLMIVFLAGYASAIEYISHDVNILITQNLDTQIKEVFQLKLNSTEKEVFNQTLSGEPKLEDLSVLGITPSFNVPIKQYTISYVMGEGGFAQVTIQYSANILKKIDDLGNKEILEITGDETAFQGNGKFVLPLRPATQIVLQFPRSFEVPEPPKPSPTQQRILAQIPGYSGEFYEYTWKGPLSSDEFSVKFLRDKPIQSQFSFQGMWEELKQRFGNPMYLAAAIIILVLLVIYRRQVLSLLKEAFAEEPVIEEETSAK